MSAIYDTFALLPLKSFVLDVGQANSFSKDKIETFLKTSAKIKRNQKLDFYLQEYFFLRIVAKKQESNHEERLFLEKKIVLEVLKLALGTSKHNRMDPTWAAQDEPVRRVLKLVESNLFSEIDIKAIAKQSGISQASLFRLFQSSVGCSPMAFVRKRRMEEAKQILMNSDRPISEIAALVGYQNFGAFSEAFSQHFKATPSSLRKKTN